MAPVAGGVADREEDQLVLAASLLKRLLIPRIPGGGRGTEGREREGDRERERERERGGGGERDREGGRERGGERVESPGTLSPVDRVGGVLLQVWRLLCRQFVARLLLRIRIRGLRRVRGHGSRKQVEMARRRETVGECLDNMKSASVLHVLGRATLSSHVSSSSEE